MGLPTGTLFGTGHPTAAAGDQKKSGPEGDRGPHIELALLGSV